MLQPSSAKPATSYLSMLYSFDKIHSAVLIACTVFRHFSKKKYFVTKYDTFNSTVTLFGCDLVKLHIFQFVL